MSAKPLPHVRRRERRAAARALRPLQVRSERGRAAPPPWRSPFVLVSIGAVVLGTALVLLAMGGPEARRSGTGLRPPASPLPASLVDGQTVGRADAPVTLEVHEDYQCPVCGRFATSFLPRLVAEFVTDGRLRIVDRPIAILGSGLPDESVDAAVGAVCAGRQNRYWDYHDLLMANQDGENEGAFRPEALEAMADLAALDREAWDDCRADPGTARTVRADTAAAAANGISSTPTFTLNGQRIVGLVAYEDLAAAIAALAPSAAP